MIRTWWRPGAMPTELRGHARAIDVDSFGLAPTIDLHVERRRIEPAPGIAHREAQHRLAPVEHARGELHRRRRRVVRPHAQPVGARAGARSRLDADVVETRARQEQSRYRDATAVAVEIGVLDQVERRLAREPVLVAREQYLRHDRPGEHAHTGVARARRHPERQDLLAARVAGRQPELPRAIRERVARGEPGALAGVAGDVAEAYGSHGRRTQPRAFDVAPPPDPHRLGPATQDHEPLPVAEPRAGGLEQCEQQLRRAARGHVDRRGSREPGCRDRPHPASGARVAQLDRHLVGRRRPDQAEVRARIVRQERRRVGGRHVDQARADDERHRDDGACGIGVRRPGRQLERGADVGGRPVRMALQQQRRRARDRRRGHAGAVPDRVAARDRQTALPLPEPRRRA